MQHHISIYRDTKTDITKITISDSVYTCSECVSSISGWSWLVLTLAILFWVFRLIKVVYHSVQYWDVKKFYNTALKIDDVWLTALNLIYNIIYIIMKLQSFF